MGEWVLDWSIEEHDRCWEELVQLWQSKEVRQWLTSIYACATKEVRDEDTITSAMAEHGDQLLARLVQQNGWDA